MILVYTITKSQACDGWGIRTPVRGHIIPDLSPDGKGVMQPEVHVKPRKESYARKKSCKIPQRGFMQMGKPYKIWLSAFTGENSPHTNKLCAKLIKRLE
jgi:hypothetical protein